jgi:hypothetical protein
MAMTAPTERVRELEMLLARIRNAGMVQLNYEMWDQRGSEHASPEQRATMEADLAGATRERAAAKTELEALVAATRAEAPAEIAAWANAHDASVATRERAEWAEVRTGARVFVDENLFYVTDDGQGYRQLFGIDPQTLERVD